MEQLMKHEFIMNNARTIISTVDMGGDKYETMVLRDDGTELESYINYNKCEALSTHEKLVIKYQDFIYNNSIEKLLGIPKKIYVKRVR